MPEPKPQTRATTMAPTKGSAQNHHYVIENVVAVLKGRAAISTNALEGLKVVDIIERIYTSGL